MAGTEGWIHVHTYLTEMHEIMRFDREVKQSLAGVVVTNKGCKDLTEFKTISLQIDPRVLKQNVQIGVIIQRRIWYMGGGYRQPNRNL